jgi:hypothetical protein
LALPIAFFFGFAFVVLLLAFGESNLQLYFTAGVMNIQRIASLLLSSYYCKVQVVRLQFRVLPRCHWYKRHGIVT